MTEIPGIKYNLQLPPGVDYDFLRKEGIRYVQELAGNIWTDYNEHDPGVTILEQLCYALTQLGYKTNLDIRKLMFSGGNEVEIGRSNAIFAPQEILISGSVTATDFRILLINALKKEKVQNVWFKPAKNQRLKGLYDIYVRASAPASDHARIEKRIREIYAQHRSLAEDLHSIIILKPEYIELSATVDINDDVVPEKVIAEVFFRANEYFNAPVINTSFHDLARAGLGYEEIFNISSFEHGFIRFAKSNEEGGMFSLSGLIADISAIPGIRAMRNLSVKKDGIKVTGKYITIEEGHVPEIRITPEKNAITVFRNYNNVNHDDYLVKRYYNEMIERGNKSYQFIPLVAEKLNENIHKQVGSYASVQLTFPVAYGIGTYGLPGNSGKERIIYARQLQSYLFFFDQLMINHLTQLENLRFLFSYRPDGGTVTYFTKFPQANSSRIKVPDLDKLTHPRLNDEQLHNLVQENFLERKNRLVDHLLARYSEEFVDRQYPDLAALYGLTDERDLDRTLLSLKCGLLERYATLSKDRNKGFNYTLPYARSSYPLKTKLCLLLNIPLENEHTLSLTEPYRSLRAQDVSEKEAEKTTRGVSDLRGIRFKVINHPEARDHLVFYGSLRDSYSIEKSESGQYAVLFHEPANESLVSLAEVESEKKAEILIFDLVSKFRRLNKKAEGFYVVEHILLRPLLEKQFDIELVISKSKLVLRSVQSDYLEEQNELLTEVVVRGTDRSSYLVSEEANGVFVTLADKEDNALLRVDKKFDSEKQATTAIDELLVPYFLKLDRGKSTVPPDVQFRQLSGYAQREEFYSSKISLILPRWIPRFNDAHFKVLLRQSLAKCIPAHVGVNVTWFGLGRMAEFERHYKEWLSHKAFVAERQQAVIEGKRDKVLRTRARKERRTLWNDIIQLDELSDRLTRILLDEDISG